MALRRLFLNRNIFQPLICTQQRFSTSGALFDNSFQETKSGKWLTYNDKMYDPQSPEEEPRPAVRLCFKCQYQKYSTV